MDFAKLNECLYEMYHRDLTYFEKMKQIQNLIAPQQKDFSDIKKINIKKNTVLKTLALHGIKTMMIATGVILCAFFLILEFKGLGVL